MVAVDYFFTLLLLFFSCHLLRVTNSSSVRSSECSKKENSGCCFDGVMAPRITTSESRSQWALTIYSVTSTNVWCRWLSNIQRAKGGGRWWGRPWTVESLTSETVVRRLGMKTVKWTKNKGISRIKLYCLLWSYFLGVFFDDFLDYKDRIHVPSYAFGRVISKMFMYECV